MRAVEEKRKRIFYAVNPRDEKFYFIITHVSA